MANKKAKTANEAPERAAAPKTSRRRGGKSTDGGSPRTTERAQSTEAQPRESATARRAAPQQDSDAGVAWGPVRVEREIGGRLLTLETGRMAKLADGACVARYGDTMVLASAQGAKERDDIDFFPLTVEYREKPAAAGRFPGGFFKREGRPTTKEILGCRIIDRSIRPLFPEGFKGEVQVLSQVLATDQENESDILAAIASFAAVALSSLPNTATLGACRIGLRDDKLVVNPTWPQLLSKENQLNLTVAAHADAIVMVEAGANQVSEAVMIEAIELGRKICVEVAEMIDELVAKAGKPKQKFVKPPRNEALAKEIDRRVGKQLRAAPVTGGSKQERKQAKEDALAALAEAFPPPDGATDKQVKDHKKFVGQIAQELMDQGERQAVLDGRRADGRDWTTIRPITIEVGVLPRVHGSVLFTRGETQALVVATLGTADDEQRIDGLYPEEPRRFLLHYNFPPFSVGEVKRIMSVGRREIGHGALAERSIEPVLPAEEVFPYTVRITSEILESNGSSSMATVCGGTLALMDAGVPLQQPVAGVAMGLVMEGKRYAILSDILGSEDHCGDMDFKVAGTGKGITALQMDIKCEGLTREILEEALEQARLGRMHVLREMLKTMRKPRETISPNAPRLISLKIPVDKIGLVIGPSGKMIRGLQEEFSTKIHIEDDGTVTVAGQNMEKVDGCVDRIRAMTAEVEVGAIYKGRISAIKEFGAFVEILPGQEGLCHVSELSDQFIRAVTDVVRVGDEIEVKVIAIDDFGKIKLSRKALLPGGAQGGPGGGRPPRERDAAPIGATNGGDADVDADVVGAVAAEPIEGAPAPEWDRPRGPRPDRQGGGGGGFDRGPRRDNRGPGGPRHGDRGPRRPRHE